MKKLPHVRPRLFCPGPTPVPSEAAIASLQTNIYHRSSEFKSHFIHCRQMLREFFDSQEEPIILSSSGTGALEAAMVNLTSVGDDILVINAGKFGERWQKLGQSYACRVNVIQVPWGQVPEIGVILAQLKQNPKTKAIFLQASETSTGVALPIEAIAKAIREQFPDILIVVDAVSALVAHHVKLKSWDLDCVISGSQKGFGTPPGLAFIALSERAWSKLSERSRFYFDLQRERQGQQDGQTAWTPATTLVLTLEAALEKLTELGVDRCVNYHVKAAESCRQAAAALGLELFSQSHHSNALTAIKLPEGMDGKQLVKLAREKYGAIFAGGQDQAKGKIIRIAHLGIFDRFDILNALSAFEFALRDMGSRHEIGIAVQAAMKTMLDA